MTVQYLQALAKVINAKKSKDSQLNDRLLFEAYKDLLQRSLNEVVLMSCPQEMRLFDELQHAVSEYFLKDSTGGRATTRAKSVNLKGLAES